MYLRASQRSLFYRPKMRAFLREKNFSMGMARDDRFEDSVILDVKDHSVYPEYPLFIN